MKRNEKGRFVEGPDKIELNLEFIKQKYSEGLSCMSIGKLLGVSPQTVHRRLIQLNVNRRPADFQKGHKQLPGSEKGWIKSNFKGKKTYPNKTVNGVKQKVHRWVMEEHLGRKLKKGEVVHHINGDPKDNRIENLALFTSQAAHMRFHILHMR